MLNSTTCLHLNCSTSQHHFQHKKRQKKQTKQDFSHINQTVSPLALITSSYKTRAISFTPKIASSQQKLFVLFHSPKAASISITYQRKTKNAQTSRNNTAHHLRRRRVLRRPTRPRGPCRSAAGPTSSGCGGCSAEPGGYGGRASGVAGEGEG